jgi:hypothetical protein
MRTYSSRFPISDNTGRAVVTVVASLEHTEGVRALRGIQETHVCAYFVKVSDF